MCLRSNFGEVEFPQRKRFKADLLIALEWLNFGFQAKLWQGYCRGGGVGAPNPGVPNPGEAEPGGGPNGEFCWPGVVGEVCPGC